MKILKNYKQIFESNDDGDFSTMESEIENLAIELENKTKKYARVVGQAWRTLLEKHNLEILYFNLVEFGDQVWNDEMRIDYIKIKSNDIEVGGDMIDEHGNEIGDGYEWIFDISYDALCDLRTALNIEISEIALSVLEKTNVDDIKKFLLENFDDIDFCTMSNDWENLYEAIPLDVMNDEEFQSRFVDKFTNELNIDIIKYLNDKDGINITKENMKKIGHIIDGDDLGLI